MPPSGRRQAGRARMRPSHVGNRARVVAAKDPPRRHPGRDRVHRLRPRRRMPKRSSRLICAGSTGKMILAQVESMWPISLRSVTALAAKRPYPERAAGPCAELAHLEEAHRNAHGASRAGAGWWLHPLHTKFCDSLTLWLADRPPWRRAQQNDPACRAVPRGGWKCGRVANWRGREIGSFRPFMALQPDLAGSRQERRRDHGN